MLTELSLYLSVLIDHSGLVTRTSTDFVRRAQFIEYLRRDPSIQKAEKPAVLHLDALSDELSKGELLPGLCAMFDLGAVLKCGQEMIFMFHEGEIGARRRRR